ncbi:hypothetical protein GCM10022243_56710 [Saccharothrix violaceirubra]|uniref:Secreted protein n=1 Tax=Saccharothrix violaceirubra TaxID=413306 RepID=A0A7W7WWE3_9PSEU|nr:hypothetical protein [Saccharothrix violaceirubra]MBB4965897.1 hypothetical protein [Saccharothrix violaceirubra]
MRSKLVMTVAAALLIGGTVAGAAAANGSTDEVAAQSGNAAVTVLDSHNAKQIGKPGGVIDKVLPRVDDVRIAASEPPSCWTQFAPTWPAGRPMAQYYRNCNGHTVQAFYGYTANGSTVNVSGCYEFVDGASLLLMYIHTNYPGATFGTFPC